MVSIVIIDDGIWVNNKEVMERLDKSYVVCADGQIVEENPEEQFCEYTHGGLCAHILFDMFRDISLTSLRVLEANGKGTIERLCAALDWCVGKQYEMVHMSLTTRNYYDYVRLHPLIEKLKTGGKVMTASLDNDGVISYPAGFPEVQAVFMDTNNLLHKDSVGIFYDPERKKRFIGVRYARTLFMNDDTSIRVAEANSFAAPVITGHLARHLAAGMNEIEAENALMKNFGQLETRTIRIPGVSKRRQERKIPVVGIIEESIDLALYCKQYFEYEGYRVAAFSEYEIENFIPLQFYLGDEMVIDEVFFNDMAEIYQVDLIVCHLCKQIDMDMETIDVVLMGGGSRIKVLENDKEASVFKEKEDVLRFVEKELQEE